MTTEVLAEREQRKRELARQIAALRRQEETARLKIEHWHAQHELLLARIRRYEDELAAAG